MGFADDQGAPGGRGEASAAGPRDLDLELQRQRVHARLFGAALPPPTLGRFALLRRIGAGGMGVVYAARDPRLDRDVALKLLHPQLGGRDATTRLLREARALARLSHPNVVQLYDVGEHDGRVFVAMEFLAGPTLRAWRDAADRDWRAIVDMYIQAGEGLAAAHAAGLVHRDFKPENVLVADRDGRPRVVDFGLASRIDAGEAANIAAEEEANEAAEGSARGGDAPPPAELPSPPARAAADPRLTLTGAALGTPGYAAPELRGGAPTTPLADQYSFCVALFEALHGARPDAGSDPSAASRRDPTSSASAVPTWVDAILARGLDPDPQRRWPSMAALLGALGRAPARARRRWLGAAAGLVAVIGLAAALSLLGDRPAAGGPARRAGDARLVRAEAAAAIADADARRDAARADATRLVSLARSRGAEDPTLGLLLAVEAVRMSEDAGDGPRLEAEQALRDRLDALRSVPLIGDGSPLAHVAVAPGGTRAATAGRDGGVRLWTVSDGAAQAQELVLGDEGGDATRATGLAFSPSGRRLVMTSADDALALWELPEETGSVLGDRRPRVRVDPLATAGPPATASAPLVDPTFLGLDDDDRAARVLARSGALAVVVEFGTDDASSPRIAALRGHEGRVHLARASRDGATIATAAADGVRLWRADGAALRQLEHGGRAEIRDLDFSPDGARLLTAGADGRARLWPLAGGPPLVLDAGAAGLRLARFAIGGAALVTIAADQRAQLWEIDGRRARPLPPSPVPDLGAAIGRLVHAPAHDLLLGTPPGGQALLWSLINPGPPLELHGHTGSVVAAAFDRRGDVIATASTDGDARLWRWGGAADVLRGHSHAVTQVAFIGDDRLLSAGMDGAARLWSLGAPADARVAVLAGRSEDAAVLVAVADDGRRLVTAAADGSAALWTADGRRLHELERAAAEPSALAFGPGDILAIGTHGGFIELRVIDAGGRPSRAWRLAADAPVTRVRFAAGGALLLAATERGDVLSWTLDATHSEEPRPGPRYVGHTAAIFDLAVAPDGERFATASEDGDVRLWSLAGGAPSDGAVLRGHGGPVWSVRFDGAGARLLSASSDATARLWSVRSPEAAAEVLRGHAGAVWSAEFSPDGALAVTSAQDGTARLWTLGAGASVVLPHAGTAPPGERDRDVAAATFSPDGTRVATAGADGVVRLFDVELEAAIADACARAGRRLTIEEWRRALDDRPYAPACAGHE